MSDNLTSALSVIFIFIAGFILRRLKIVDIKTAKDMAYVVMYLTLPCAIITLSNGIVFDFSLIIILLFSFIFNIILLAVGYFSFKEPSFKLFAMLNVTGFNIGNFVIPFTQDTLGPKAFLALCMFDLINAFFCFGGNYAFAMFTTSKKLDGSQHTIKLSKIFKEIVSSVTIYAYILAIVLSILAIKLPDIVLAPLSTVAKANTFLCMLVIGFLINLKISFKTFLRLIKIVLIRYSTTLIFCVFIYLISPFDKEVNFVLMAILLAPVTTTGPLFTLKSLPQLGQDSANINTICILTSIIMLTLLNSLSPILLH